MTIDIRPFLRLGKFFWLLSILGFMLTAPQWTLAEISATDGPHIGAIAERLADDDTSIRTQAALKLKEYGQSAMPFLIGIREYGSPAQRRGAVVGMGLLPIPGLATEEILLALDDADVATRSLAAHVLALIGPSAAPQLTHLLSSESEQVRAAAGYSLMLMGVEAVPALAAVVAGEDRVAAPHAAWLLGQMGPQAKAAVPALISLLDADDIRVMHVAAEAIDLIGPDPALVQFHFLLLGRQTTTFDMGQIGSKAAPTLVRLLTRPGTPTSQIAFRALASMGRAATLALKEVLRSGTPSQQTAAALLLVDIDPSMVHELPEDVRKGLAGAHQPEQ